MSEDVNSIDKSMDSLIDEIVKEVPTRKLKGRLNNHRVYLAGPIDHADDDGVAWRQKLSPYLKKMGLTILDPTDKPVSQCRYNEVGAEKDHIQKLKKLKRWDELRNLAKEIVLVDLRMVEVSDFMIAYVDKDIHLCGTYDEIFESLRRRKPTLIVHKGGKAEMSMWLRGKMNHNFIFDSFDELYEYLEALHDGTVEPDYTRWVFFDKV
jgi:nucleoside 2-deoxyribosyltransferase|tara:strand:+ start:190 stop:813 length:624 start_codon:yes stop_codon:yes gene_type:complete